MAERRMMAKSIIDSDMFLDMPITARLLYYDLNMRADDDGFVDAPKKIMRIVGASQDDLSILVAKQFVIPFDSGVVVIRHWRIHNYIQSDRYKPTVHQEEKKALRIQKNKAYSLTEGVQLIPETVSSDSKCDSGVSAMDTECIHDVSSLETQVRLGKVRLGKVSKDINNNICAEPDQPATAPEPSEPPVYQIILNDGKFFGVTQTMIDEYAKLYPAVDVHQEIRKMIGWCDANPSRRKTKRGIRAFINSWLSKSQDRGTRQRQDSGADDWRKGLDIV